MTLIIIKRTIVNLGGTPLDRTISYKAMERKPGHSGHTDRSRDHWGKVKSINTSPRGTYSFDWQS